MNNEPVAWIPKGMTLAKPKDLTNCIPLYTHPVNPKYDPETGEPLIDGYPLFSGLPHPAKEQGNPVAWRSKDPDGYWSVYQAPVEGAEPLYTGFKELTDEEIAQEWGKFYPDVFHTHLIDFARAILRKASEK